MTYADPTQASTRDAPEPGGGQDRQVREEMVEAPTRAADDRDDPGATGHRGADGQLQVRLVLLAGVGLDRRARGARRRQQARIDRVEVTDHQVDRAAERHGVIQARIGGDDEGVARKTGRDRPRWRIATREHESDVAAHLAPFAGITRIRFEGSATP